MAKDSIVFVGIDAANLKHALAVAERKRPASITFPGPWTCVEAGGLKAKDKTS